MENSNNPLENFSDSVEGLERAAKSIDSIRQSFLNTWSYISRIWKSPKTGESSLESASSKRKILILGAGGTGKSTLGKFLAGDFGFPFSSQYEESISIEEYSMEDDPSVEIVVPPGQEDRRPVTWVDLLKQMQRGDIGGVILVSSFGFHSFDGELEQQKLFDGSRARFLENYLKEKRDIELQILGNLVSSFPTERKIWMISVFSKEDLRCGNPEAKNFDNWYFESGYDGKIKEIQNRLGIINFRHEKVSVALTIQNFSDGSGKILHRTSAGYDFPRYGESLYRLFRVIQKLVEWEDQQ